MKISQIMVCLIVCFTTISSALKEYQIPMTNNTNQTFEVESRMVFHVEDFPFTAKIKNEIKPGETLDCILTELDKSYPLYLKNGLGTYFWPNVGPITRRSNFKILQNNNDKDPHKIILEHWEYAEDYKKIPNYLNNSSPCTFTPKAK